MKNKFILVVTLFFYNIATADVMVEGKIDCGMWLDSRKSNQSQSLEHFLLGTVNGLAIGSDIEIWQADGLKVSREQLYYWMDGYCQKHPLSSPITGVLKFANERTNSRYERRFKK